VLAHEGEWDKRRPGSTSDQAVVRFMLKHPMGIIGALLAVWGAGSICAFMVSYVSWLQGVFGAICLVCALGIYWVWFRSRAL
jgi:hypothetical protein